jgi:SAM-dependent methyltransferase
VLQVGGKGTHAARFLLAGAANAWVVSPMLEELRHGAALARHLGLEASYHCVAGIAEEMPFRDGTFDAIYSESCVHHMVTELASTELRRILTEGGRFAAVEPWRGPLYRWGIKVFGKREKGVKCQPMTAARAQPFLDVFDQAEVIHHGAISRYPLLALAQLGWELEPPTVYAITRLDDACATLIPPLRRTGSSTAILGTRRPASGTHA